MVDDADRMRFLDELRAVVGGHGWRCGAYCVLDTHAHLVVCTPEPNLGAGMKLFLGRYAYTHNRRHGRQGHLLGRRFWSRRVDKPHYLRCAALYTVLNPVAAGICSHPGGFRWSSYRETAAATRASGLLDLGWCWARLPTMSKPRGPGMWRPSTRRSPDSAAGALRRRGGEPSSGR